MPPCAECLLWLWHCKWFRGYVLSRCHVPPHWATPILSHHPITSCHSQPQCHIKPSHLFQHVATLLGLCVTSCLPSGFHSSDEDSAAETVVTLIPSTLPPFHVHAYSRYPAAHACMPSTSTSTTSTASPSLDACSRCRSHCHMQVRWNLQRR